MSSEGSRRHHTRSATGRFAPRATTPEDPPRSQTPERIPGSLPPENRRTSPAGATYHSQPPTPTDHPSIPFGPPTYWPRTPPPSSRHPCPPSPQSSRRQMAAPVAKSAKLNIGELEFKGDKSKFREWKEHVDLYMIGNSEQFPTDEKKVTFALSYITGSNAAKLWRSSKQRAYAATGWTTWATFEAELEKEYGDPAAEEKAVEYLRTYKQGTTSARKFFSNLELWFSLAAIADAAEQLAIAKKAMNPQLRSSLTLVGFPTSYSGLKRKMVDLEDEEQKMDPSANPRTMDSHLADQGSSSF